MSETSKQLSKRLKKRRLRKKKNIISKLLTSKKKQERGEIIGENQKIAMDLMSEIDRLLKESGLIWFTKQQYEIDQLGPEQANAVNTKMKEMSWFARELQLLREEHAMHDANMSGLLRHIGETYMMKELDMIRQFIKKEYIAKAGKHPFLPIKTVKEEEL